MTEKNRKKQERSVFVDSGETYFGKFPAVTEAIEKTHEVRF
jgi:hypothetical protein